MFLIYYFGNSFSVCVCACTCFFFFGKANRKSQMHITQRCIASKKSLSTVTVLSTYRKLLDTLIDTLNTLFLFLKKVYITKILRKIYRFSLSPIVSSRHWKKKNRDTIREKDHTKNKTKPQECPMVRSTGGKSTNHL